MSGIAGILRRDGGPVPKKWGDLLEQSLLFGGGTSFRYEHSIPVDRGDLHILLLSSSGSTESNPSCQMFLDGDIDGECAFARWNEETLELELARRGSGQKSLYWLDLAQAGDGLVFSTNPLPLLSIARELDFPSETISQDIREYVHDGFVMEGGRLLAPLYSMPVQRIEQSACATTSSLLCDFTSSLAEDVQTLVRILGTPFADPTLLSTLQQYRYAKENKFHVVDGVALPKSKRLLKHCLPLKQHEKQKELQRNAARIMEIGAIANFVGVDLSISTERNRIEPISFPLSSWLQSSQSKLGQLANDTLRIREVFGNLPVNQSECIDTLEAHQAGKQDNSKELFALLTLALWSQLVRA
jgi:hypothetical protein